MLDVRGLTVAYGHGRQAVTAANKVTFSIPRNSTLGLVGESGSGKTTVGRAIIRLLPTAGGEIHFEGTEISSLSQAGFLPYRKRIQMIFQDPYSSLDPRLSIRGSLREALELGFPSRHA